MKKKMNTGAVGQLGDVTMLIQTYQTAVSGKSRILQGEAQQGETFIPFPRSPQRWRCGGITSGKFF